MKKLWLDDVVLIVGMRLLPLLGYMACLAAVVWVSVVLWVTAKY